MGDTAQYIEILLDFERFAIHISDLHEIIRMQKITPLPNARAHMKGIINLRGLIIPVFCLRSRFNMTAVNTTKSSRIVVVRREEEKIGLIVDQVSHVIQVSKIQPSPETLGGMDTAFFSAIGDTDSGLVYILSLEHIISE